jgi:hypothetical protein
MNDLKNNFISLWSLVSLHVSNGVLSIKIDREVESPENMDLYLNLILVNTGLYQKFIGTFPSIINLLNSLSPTQVKDLSVTDLFDRILS